MWLLYSSPSRETLGYLSLCHAHIIFGMCLPYLRTNLNNVLHSTMFASSLVHLAVKLKTKEEYLLLYMKFKQFVIFTCAIPSFSMIKFWILIDFTLVFTSYTLLFTSSPSFIMLLTIPLPPQFIFIHALSS